MSQIYRFKSSFIDEGHDLYVALLCLSPLSTIFQLYRSIYNRYACIHILIRYVELKYTETIDCSPLFVSVSFILFYICVINKGQTRATDGFDIFDF